MRWIDGLSPEAQKRRGDPKEKWHKWFAWYPVVVGFTGNGTDERKVKVWGEVVLRKGRFWANELGNGYDWAYRLNGWGD